jgi:hypothetical protein
MHPESRNAALPDTRAHGLSTAPSMALSLSAQHTAALWCPEYTRIASPDDTWTRESRTRVRERRALSLVQGPSSLAVPNPSRNESINICAALFKARPRGAEGGRESAHLPEAGGGVGGGGDEERGVHGEDAVPHPAAVPLQRAVQRKPVQVPQLHRRVAGCGHQVPAIERRKSCES